MLKFGLIFFLLFLISCDEKESYIKLNSFPEWNEDKFKAKENDSSLYFFVVGGFSESLFPATELKPNNLPKEMPHALKVGGVAILSSYLNTIRERLPNRSVILGLEGQGPLSSDPSKKQLILESIKKMPLDTLLLTKKNLPLKSNTPEDEFLKGLPWLNSNILSIKTGEPATPFGSSPYHIIERAGVKIGVIGISSYELLDAKERNEITGFYFQDPVTTILKYKDILKKEGADFLIVVMSARNHCQEIKNQRFLFFKDLQNTKNYCNEDFEVKKLLDRLPPNSIDLIFTDQNQTAATIYRNTPIISTYNPNTYISGVRISFERDNINFEESIVLPQIKLCHQMFAGTLDCTFQTGEEDFDTKRFDILGKSAFGLVSSRFLGKEMIENQEILEVINGK